MPARIWTPFPCVTQSVWEWGSLTKMEETEGKHGEQPRNCHQTKVSDRPARASSMPLTECTVIEKYQPQCQINSDSCSHTERYDVKSLLTWPSIPGERQLLSHPHKVSRGHKHVSLCNKSLGRAKPQGLLATSGSPSSPTTTSILVFPVTFILFYLLCTT